MFAGGVVPEFYAHSATVPQGQGPINAIPSELISYIFNFLPPAELGNMASICREWHAAVNSENLWQRVCQARGYEKSDSQDSYRNLAQRTINAFCNGDILNYLPQEYRWIDDAQERAHLKSKLNTRATEIIDTNSGQRVVILKQKECEIKVIIEARMQGNLNTVQTTMVNLRHSQIPLNIRFPSPIAATFKENIYTCCDGSRLHLLSTKTEKIVVFPFNIIWDIPVRLPQINSVSQLRLACEWIDETLYFYSVDHALDMMVALPFKPSL